MRLHVPTCCTALATLLALSASAQPDVQVTLKLDAATEDFASLSNRSRFQPAPGVVWVPDMHPSGHLLFLNSGPGDFVAKQGATNLLQRVRFLGAMINQKLYRPEELPPVKFSFHPDASAIVLKPGGAGVQVRFAFDAPVDGQWPVGTWEPVFAVDLVPGQSPLRLSGSVRVRAIEQPEDRLNVRALEYQQAMASDNYTNALRALNELLAALPDDGPLLQKRADLLTVVDELAGAEADLAALAALVESGRSRRPVTVPGAHGSAEILEQLVERRNVLVSLRSQAAALEALSRPASDAAKAQIRVGLQSTYPTLQLKAIAALRRLGLSPERFALVPLLSASDTANQTSLDGRILLVREEAWQALSEVWPASRSAGFDPRGPEAERQRAISRLPEALK